MYVTIDNCISPLINIIRASDKVLQQSPQGPNNDIDYEIRLTSTGVCITCTFLDSSTTDCVAVVHQ